MNEQQKRKIVIFCVLVFVSVIIVQSIFYNTEVRQRDREIDRIERELEATSERLEISQREVRASREEITDSRTTITECRKSICTIADRLEGEDGGLQGIIKDLSAIREEVFLLENSLNLYYSKYGNPDGDTDFLTEVN